MIIKPIFLFYIHPIFYSLTHSLNYINFNLSHMIKLTVLVSLIAMVCSVNFFGHKFFKDEIKEESLYAGDQIQKGSAITPEIQTKIKTFAEQAFVFNGNNQLKNILFIQQQMNNLYGGTWVVAIYGGPSNYSQPIYGKNVGIASYSANGQWWIYWKGVNHYQPYYAYYLSRQETNSSTYICATNSNYSYNSSSTDMFRNVVNAAEWEFNDIQNFTAEVQYYLHEYSPDISATVTAVNSTIPFYICTWGANSSNYIQRTDRYGMAIVSTPRVGSN